MNNNFFQSQKYIKTDEFHLKFIRFVKGLLIFNTFLNIILNFFLSYYITYFFYFLYTIKFNTLQIVNGEIIENNQILFLFFGYIVLYVTYILFFKIKIDLKTILIKKFKIIGSYSYGLHFLAIFIGGIGFFLFQLYDFFYFKVYGYIFLSIFLISCINIAFLHKMKVEIVLERPIKITSMFSFLRKKVYQYIIFQTLEIDKK